MRTIFSILLLTLIINSSAISQLKNFGVYFSPTLNFRTENKNDNISLLYNSGISYEVYYTPKLSTSIALEYSLEGFENTANVIGQISKGRLGYVGLPIQTNYNLVKTYKFKVDFFLGIKIKQLLFADYSHEKYNESGGYYESPMTTITESYSRKDLKALHFNMINYDFLAGLRFEYSINHLSFGVSPEFRRAILQTQKDDIIFSPYDYNRHYLYGMKFSIVKK